MTIVFVSAPGVRSQFRRTAHFIRLPEESIHLREKNIAGPTCIFVRKTLRVRPERSEDAEASSKLEEEDLRFSMKMMLAPAFETSLQSV